MQNEEMTTAREWLTVDEAFLACQEVGLDRTKKTIRSWARNEHVEAKKQSTPTGERWMVEKASWGVKIRSELEFQRHNEGVQTGSNPSEPVQPKDEPVRTRADQSEPVRTGAHDGEGGRTDETTKAELNELRTQLRSLEIDKAVRDRHIEFLSKQNEEGQTNLLSQSRYIGHLETQVLQLGGKPNERFLEAPVAREPDAPEPQVMNPHQSPLHTVQ